MTQVYLYMRYRGGAFSQNAVFKEVNRQLTQVGGDFGIKAPDGSAQHSFNSDNRVVNWNNDLYAVGVSGIWKYDVAAGGPWTLASTFTGRNANGIANSMRLGFTTASLNGEPRLITAYPTSTANTNVRFYWVTTSGTFGSSPEVVLPSFNAISTNDGLGECISYRNSIVFGGTDRIYEVSIEDWSVSTATTPISNYGSSFIVFRDRVLELRVNSANAWDVYRKDGSIATLIARFGAGVNGVFGFSRSNRGAIIQVDDNTLVCFAFLDANAGGEESHRCIVLEFPPDSWTPTVTDVTSQVMPSELRNVGVSERTSRITARLDLVSSTPNNPVYELEFYRIATSEGNSVSLYKYVPTSGTQLEFIDSGLDGFGYSTISMAETCGKNIWPGSGTINVSPPTLEVDGANINATFKIFGPASLSGQVALEVWYDKEGFSTMSRGSLQSTDVGSLSGNTVIGLSPGDTVTVAWRAAIDGIGVIDNPKVAGLVYVQ